MPREVLQGWYAGSDGNYVDCTFGRGGHSSLMLEKLSGSGALLGVDRDPEAIAEAQRLASLHANFDCEQLAFADLDAALQRRGWRGQVAGIFMDLGVSSPQLDDASRGFSFMRDGPLDMRMDPGRGRSAAEWLADANAGQIADVLFRYGEERHSRRIAAAIVERREQRSIDSTGELAELIENAIPARERYRPGAKHAATKSFQAIRIFINDELGQLQEFLESCMQWLRPGGRLAVISFHSLEDRMVKRFMRDKASGDKLPARVPIRDAELNRELRIVVRNCRAGAEELAVNPRARSAVLRVAEKI